MPEGFISESEAQFMRDKPKKMEKFNQVFDFYHETVPREEQPKPQEEPQMTVEDTNNGVQTLDASVKEEEKA